jgi:hypothetical protein
MNFFKGIHMSVGYIPRSENVTSENTHHREDETNTQCLSVAPRQKHIVAPNLGDRLNERECDFESSLQDVVSSVVGIHISEFQRTSEGRFFSKAIGPLKAVLQLFRTLGKEDDFEDFTQKCIAEASSTLEEMMNKQLVLANVRTPSQLRQKVQKIKTMKTAAEKVFYGNTYNRAQLIAADEAMIRSSCGELSSKHVAVIRKYWEYISSIEDGHRIHEDLQKRLISCVLDISEKLSSDTLQFASQQPTEIEQAQRMIEIVKTSASQEHACLLHKRAHCSGEEEEIRLDYLLLLHQVIGKALFQFLLQENIYKLAQTLEVQVTNHNLETDLLDLHIQFAKDNISRCQAMLTEDYCPWTLSDESEESEEFRLWRERLKEEDKQRTIEAIKKLQNELQALLNFKAHPGSFLKYIYGDPATLYSLVPLMTLHEQAIVQQFFPRQKCSPLENPFTIANDALHMHEEELSTQYFVSQLEAEAERKTSLFSQLANKVTVVV